MEWFQRLALVLQTARPVFDVAILTVVLYKAYSLLFKTQGLQLIKGAGILGAVYGVSFLFKLSTLEWLLGLMAPGLFIAVAIIFQPELRQLFLRLGQGELFRPGVKPKLGHLEAAVTAAEILSREKRGMLLVFPRRVSLKHIVETGTRLNADLSSSLIVTVFEFDGPLHDGAMVIQNGKIIAAGCFLPLSEQQDIKKSFGTRHRASLGMSEQSDAVVLVVSEETGAISIACESRLYYDLSTGEVTRKLREFLEKGPSRQGDAGAALVTSPQIMGEAAAALAGEDLGEAFAARAAAAALAQEEAALGAAAGPGAAFPGGKV